MSSQLLCGGHMAVLFVSGGRLELGLLVLVETSAACLSVLDCSFAASVLAVGAGAIFPFPIALLAFDGVGVGVARAVGDVKGGEDGERRRTSLIVLIAHPFHRHIKICRFWAVLGGFGRFWDPVLGGLAQFLLIGN